MAIMQNNPPSVGNAAENTGITPYYPGREGPIGEAQVKEATGILNEYKRSKANLERRIVENEQWWKMRHWDLIRKASGSDPEPASAWLFNSIANKHADAMDNFPEPCILPREDGDRENAKMLSSIIPAILEYNSFEDTYSDVWWYKLKTGTGCYGVFWNSSLEDGLGDIDIRQIDILNVFWEGGVKDIQRSRNLFTVELEDNDYLETLYPFLRGKLSGNGVDIASYMYDDQVDTSSKSAVIDWYYKKGSRLHYCKYVGDTVIYASENDPAYADRGYYDHGKYPLVFDTLFVEEGTPCGFGYIDIMKDVQMYIDKLNQIIIKNAMQAGKRRFFISDNAGINEEEFADWSREFVHVSGNIDDRNLREITVSQLDSSIIGILNQKIDELKETSGNRDVSQGGTASGVTAASAIAALQEAGSKLSRDMIKSSYRAFRSINYLVIELIRQFYDESRSFRITGESGDMDFAVFDNRSIRLNERGMRPVFDVSVSSQRKSPFSKTAQNELAKQLYSAGMFNPESAVPSLVCLDMMDFEGKSNIVNKVSENSTQAQQMQLLRDRVEKLTEIVNRTYGINLGGDEQETVSRRRKNPTFGASSTATEEGNIMDESSGKTKPGAARLAEARKTAKLMRKGV